MGNDKTFCIHACRDVVFNNSDDTLLRFQICRKGKEIYIKTRWVKVRRKNDIKEKAKEIKRGKEKESEACGQRSISIVANFHICAVGKKYAASLKQGLNDLH